MTISPDIFKAYDVRALYPSELNETAARLIGRAYVAYLESAEPGRTEPLRIALTRDMRTSSPSLAKASRLFPPLNLLLSNLLSLTLHLLPLLLCLS